MTDSIYNIPDLRQKIKELTREENFPLLREQDVIKIKPVILQYLNNCSNEGIKTEIVQSIVVPLKIKGIEDILFHEFEHSVSAEYRWHLGDALSISFTATEENIQKINSLLEKFSDYGIGRLLFIVQKFHLCSCYNSVIKLLETRDDPVITAAIETLGIIGNKTTIPLLTPFINSSNSFVRNEVRKSISKLNKVLE